VALTGEGGVKGELKHYSLLFYLEEMEDTKEVGEVQSLRDPDARIVTQIEITAPMK
jgi:hypothetical protein